MTWEPWLVEIIGGLIAAFWLHAEVRSWFHE
jgi:hypothetical protein